MAIHAYQEERAQPMWEAIMRRVPSINEGVVVRQIGTPLTHARFLRRHRGNYGLALAAGGCVAHHPPPPPSLSSPLLPRRPASPPSPLPPFPLLPFLALCCGLPPPPPPHTHTHLSRVAASREFKFPEVTTPLPGLYRCGDSTTAGIGVPAVATSGAQCAKPSQAKPSQCNARLALLHPH
jgi:phytoene dehydrogenase-like protein